MARCVNPGGTVDVLSLAILEDLKREKDTKQWNVGKNGKFNRTLGSKYIQNLPKDAEASYNPSQYDKGKHWVHCACATAICALIYGILNLLPLFVPYLKHTYDIGPVKGIVVASATFAIVFCFSPVANAMVNCMGHRLTCIFGHLLLFGGLLLDAMELHVIAFYAAHFLLIGLGSCFALTSAASSVLRHFRVKLSLALTILNVASPIGTLFFHAIYYLLSVKSDMTYKWIVVTMAIMVLISIALTHPLPKISTPARHPNPFAKKVNQNKVVVKKCVESVTFEKHGQGDTPHHHDLDYESEDDSETDEEEGSRDSCVCVCELDVSAFTDIPFLLWVVLSSCAAVTIYVPCAFLIWNVQVTYNFGLESCLFLVIWLCLGSVLGRAIVMMSKNHTYKFSRTIFQVGAIGSAVVYGLLYFTSAYGWFLLWCFCAGLTEGLMVSAIPKVTLQTIPRKFMSYCWGYTVFCNGAASMVGPYLFMYSRTDGNGDIGVACAAVAIMQFCAAALAIFLPNENN